MGAVTQKKQLEQFKTFISDKSILLLDPSPTTRAAIARLLCTMGARAQLINSANTYQEAVACFEQKKPPVIISEFELGKKSGLDFFLSIKSQIRQSSIDQKNTLFLLVTGNTAQSAIAKAAEEDIDGVILKPFTADMFRRVAVDTVVSKLNVTDYQKTLEVGRQAYYNAKYDEAVKALNEAMPLHQAPSLACYYLGLSHQKAKRITEAEQAFIAGIKHNKVHLRCLEGLYELYTANKRLKDAYQILKRISQYYPANPERLTQVLRLAVMTGSWEDIERYYLMFTQIDERDEEMIKFVCAALVVCGKYYLKYSLQSRALELFKKAATTASGRTRILREIIAALAGFGLTKDAESVLAQFQGPALSTADFAASELLLAEKTQQKSAVLAKGKEAIKKGFHDPSIYRVLISCAASLGFSSPRDDYHKEACTRWPEQKREFDSARETPSASSAKLPEKKAVN